MKKMFFGVAGILLITLACGSSAPAVSEQSSVETVVAGTLQAATANAPTQQTGISVSFQNVSFVIPEGLALGANSELIPEANETNSDPWGIAPEHILFILTGYPTTSKHFEPVVRVYPAQEYAAVSSWAENSLTRLQKILADPSQPFTNENLPRSPFNGAAAQQYAAQAKILAFNGGTGVRMISQYGQFPGQILKDNSFYHYEGLTSDGKYMVAIQFPVSLPLLTTAENLSADGVPFPSDISDTTGLSSYYQGITDKLNLASPDSFQPTLTQLDQLIQSITIISQ